MLKDYAKASHLAGYFSVLTLYLALNMVLNLTNKWALRWFPFPLLLTACHMSFIFVFLLPMMLGAQVRSRHRDTLRGQWKGLIIIGLFLGLNISLNNTALVNMSLSLNQVIRASIPVFTCLLSVLFEHKSPSKQEAGSLVVLTMGTMIAMWKSSAAGKPFAVALCMAGTISNAGMMSLSGRLLSKDVDALQLTFYTAPISFLAVLPAFLMRELFLFLGFWQSHLHESYAILLVTSIVALAYNLVHALMIQQTSAVTTTVIGQIKIVGLLVLSAIVLGERKAFTQNMTFGSILALLGFCWYSHQKLQSKTAATEDVLPLRCQQKDITTKMVSDPKLSKPAATEDVPPLPCQQKDLTPKKVPEAKLPPQDLQIQIHGSC